MTFDLNPDQREAAECLSRPVLVSAGAGSGKTRMVTQRFINALVPGAVNNWNPVEVDQILTITFTEKAAAEVGERVRRALFAASRGDEARQLDTGWISTVHGLCSRLLRRHPFDAGVDPLFKVADTVEANVLAEAAFGGAARAVLDAGERGAALLDAYPFSGLFRATRAVVRELSVAGLTTQNLQLEEPPSLRQLLAEATALFREGLALGECDYHGSSRDPADHVARCRDALTSCALIEADCPTEREGLECLFAGVRAYRPLKSLKGTEEAAAWLDEQRTELVQRTVSALVAPLASAFVQLAEEYSVRYEESKAAAGLLDFDDLQSKAVSLLERHAGLAKAYRERFRVVMVDEFQDTDALQLRLVQALSEDDLCTVGDEKQSIYRFRGADVGVYRAHREQMTRDGALVCSLNVNYRSHEQVLAFINRLFGSREYFGADLDRLMSPNGGRGPNSLDAPLGNRTRVETIFVDGTGAAGRLCEANEIASRLRGLRDAGVPAGGMAILLRRYRYAHVYAQALSRAGVDGIIVGGSRFFGLAEIAVMRAFCRTVANTEDSAALGQLLVSEFVPISDDTLAILRAEEPQADGTPSLWRLVCNSSPSLHEADRAALERLVTVIENARERVGQMRFSELVLRAVEEAGYDLQMLGGGNVGRDAFANVLKFARLADSYEDAGGVGLAGFVAHLDTKERLNYTAAPVSVSDDGSDAVRIMSIHASKGLEFPVVVVPDLAGAGGSDSSLVRTSLADGMLRVSVRKLAGEDSKANSEQAVWFARFGAEDDEADTQEQARVLYVACTRAREMLIMSGSANLSPKSGTKASNDLVRLSRILGLDIPITGVSEEVLVLDENLPCRRSVVVAEDVDDVTRFAETLPNSDALPPPLPEPFDDALAPIGLPGRLSYTQMMEFEYCPRRFWIRRVLGVRQDELRIGEADPLAFGVALHAALRLVGAELLPPEATRLRAIARYFELPEVEIERLGEAVRAYCGSEVARAVAEAASVRHESPFALRVGGGSFLLVGSIDVYARSGASALIVDYKSGESGESDELAERYGLQAECYALAALRDGCESVAVQFVRPEVVLPDGSLQGLLYEFGSADGPAIESRLLERFREMERSFFAPKPSRAQCSRCQVPVRMCPERTRAENRVP